MKFEKWQALGNDYVIVEETRAPVRAHARADPRALRAAHGRRLGRRAAAARDRRARLRRRAADLQPGRLGGRAVGQRRARGDPLPAPRRLDRRGRVLGAHRRRARSGRGSPGRARARWTWAARSLQLEATSRAAREDGAGTLESARPRVRVPVRADRQPAVRDRGRADELEAARPAALRARRSSSHELFPNRTNVSFWRARTPTRDPRAHLRARRGGDDVVRHRRDAARRWRPCCAVCDSPVTVRARRRRARGRGGRGPAREPDRLGASPSTRDVLSEEFLEELHADRVSAWSACPRTCSPSWSGRSRRRRPPGVDVISLGIGDPDTPTPAPIVDALAAGGAPTPARTSTRPTAGGPSSARRSRASTSAASAWTLDPETEIIPALGAQGVHLQPQPRVPRPGRRGAGGRPRLPGLHRRPAAGGRRGGADAAAARARLRARPRRDRRATSPSARG